MEKLKFEKGGLVAGWPPILVGEGPERDDFVSRAHFNFNMKDIKIKLKIGEKEVEISRSEARLLYFELKSIFGPEEYFFSPKTYDMSACPPQTPPFYNPPIRGDGVTTTGRSDFDSVINYGYSEED